MILFIIKTSSILSLVLMFIVFIISIYYFEKVIQDLKHLEYTLYLDKLGTKKERYILLKHNYTEDEIERFFNIRLKMIRLYEIIYMTKY